MTTHHHGRATMVDQFHMMAGPREGGATFPSCGGRCLCSFVAWPARAAHWVVFTEPTLILALLGLCSAGQVHLTCVQGGCMRPDSGCQAGRVGFAVESGASSVRVACRRSFGLTVAVLRFVAALAVPGLCSSPCVTTHHHARN